MIRTISRAEKEGHDRAVRLGVVHYYVNSAVLYCEGIDTSYGKLLAICDPNVLLFLTAHDAAMRR